MSPGASRSLAKTVQRAVMLQKTTTAVVQTETVTTRRTRAPPTPVEETPRV